MAGENVDSVIEKYCITCEDLKLKSKMQRKKRRNSFLEILQALTDVHFHLLGLQGNIDGRRATACQARVCISTDQVDTVSQARRAVMV